MINVIIADDDINARKGLEIIIKWKELGVEVVLTANNGKQVADFLYKNKVDLIISDVKMPLMNGVELSKYVKGNFCDTSVILISAYADFEYVREALNYNVKGYILRPMDNQKVCELSDLIKKVVETKENKRKLNF